MFTGIVEELGAVRAITPNAGGARIEIAAELVLDDAVLGASIAVNGCCLTVVELLDGGWAADAVTETLDRTSLGSLRPGDPVNLERPVRLADRLGGHIVQGHVDAVGTLDARRALPDGSTRMTFTAPASVLRHVVEKGSITVDGISLTVASLDDSPDDANPNDGDRNDANRNDANPNRANPNRAGSTFDVAVIPHTLAVTTLGAKQPGDPVNLEVDVLAKYVERLLTTHSSQEH